MKVISVNLGEKKEVSWRGKKVYTGIFKYPVNQSIYLGKTDVVNDQVIDRKYHGGIDKACYIYSANHYTFWKTKHPDLDWNYGMFGENITLQGMNESDLRIGDVFELGEAIIQISQPRQPCFKLGIRFRTQKVLKEFIKAPYPGAYLRVVSEGSVALGDELKLIEKGAEELNLARVYELMYQAQKEDVAELKTLLASKEVTLECKEDLAKQLKRF
jgi:MOSC domain-containing protein YiiM